MTTTIATTISYVPAQRGLAAYWIAQRPADGLEIERDVPRAVTVGAYSTREAALEANPGAIIGLDESGSAPVASWYVVQYETGSRRTDGPGRRDSGPYVVHEEALERAAVRRSESGNFYEYRVESAEASRRT